MSAATPDLAATLSAAQSASTSAQSADDWQRLAALLALARALAQAHAAAARVKPSKA